MYLAYLEICERARQAQNLMQGLRSSQGSRGSGDGSGQQSIAPGTQNAAYHFGCRKPEVFRARDGVLGPFENADRVADGILPWNRLRVQIVVQIKYGALNISDAPEIVLGYIGAQDRFWTGKNDPVGMRVRRPANLFLDQLFEEACFAVFIA